MKIISELNNKWWYRLTKIIYVSIFLAIMLGGGFAIFDSYSTKLLDYDNTMVNCKSGVSAPLSQIDSSASYDDVQVNENSGRVSGFRAIGSPLLTNSFGTKLREFCSKKVIEMKDGSKKFLAPDNLSSIDTKNIAKADGENFETLPPPPRGQQGFTLEQLLAKGVTPLDDINYQIDIVLVNQTQRLVFSLFGWLFGCVIVFEILKRLFYYVVLGTFRPKK